MKLNLQTIVIAAAVVALGVIWFRRLDDKSQAVSDAATAITPPGRTAAENLPVYTGVQPSVDAGPVFSFLAALGEIQKSENLVLS